MAENRELVFREVLPEQFAALQARARAAGIEMNGPEGRAAQFGAEVAWKYLEQEKTLTLDCLRAPFFMTREAVLAKIEAMARESLKG
jgi:hypothetical protein